MTDIVEIKKLILEENKKDKSIGSLHNSWRSKVYNKKGKNIGFPEEWKDFEVFKAEMSNGWERGMILIRKDINLPYSKENCIWVEKGCESIPKLIKLTYKNETKTIIEWCKEFNLNYSGVKNRYFKHKDKPVEEILFGIKIKPKRKISDVNELKYQKQRDKASKMVSSYKCKDKKKNYTCDLDIEFMIDLMNKPCIYCGDSKLIGADRIDNTIGHTKKNVVPCCYTCNTARNSLFTHSEMLILGQTIRKIKTMRDENK